MNLLSTIAMILAGLAEALVFYVGWIAAVIVFAFIVPGYDGSLETGAMLLAISALLQTVHKADTWAFAWSIWTWGRFPARELAFWASLGTALAGFGLVGTDIVEQLGYRF